MCFCAGASFTIGSVLSVVGGATLIKVPRKSFLIIALIPLIFGIQQFVEGIIWLQINGEFQPTFALGQAMPYIYLVFAWVLWPTFCPIALLIPEKVLWRKIVCL